ncbi:MAG TPA: sigma factor [Pedobacter sp.]
MAIPSCADGMDENMTALFREGDESDYLKLYNKYAPAVLGVLTRSIGNQKKAEECMHEAFCKIWSERLNYDPEKERLFTWMLKTAKKSAMYEAVTRNKCPDDEIREEFDLVYAMDIRSYLQKKRQTEGAQFAAGVNEKIRTAINLIYFDAWSFADAAKKSGISTEALRGEMIRTIKQLKGSVLA